MDLLQRLVTTDFMPHGYCYLWLPEVLWLHVVSDGLIALAYFAIPIALAFFAARRREVPFPWMFLMFAAFIFACGVTHVFGIWTVWNPEYGVEGLAKAATAVISVATASLLIPVLPKALALKSPAELEALNQRLLLEIERHEATAAELRRTRDELELRVAERTAALALSEERLQVALEAARLGAWDHALGRDDEAHWDARSREILGLPADGPVGIDAAIERIHPDDRAMVRAAYRKALRAQDGAFAQEARLAAAGDDAPRWIAAYGMARGDDGAGRRDRITGVILDVTERKAAEERQRLLMGELNHRVKNILALVQAIANQTSRSAGSLPEFVAAFRGRISALATAHDQLVVSGWQGARLGDLARATLHAHAADAPGGLTLELADLLLPPALAQDLALALHELATNAAKYGALSTTGGRVTLEARLELGELVLIWRETGGPPVEAPVRPGFGTTLLAHLVAHQRKGAVHLDWRAEGLVCELRMALHPDGGASESLAA